MSKGKKRKQQPIAALQSKERKSNPFESVFNRNRFETPGRNLKGGQKNVVQSRSHAIEKRKKTLLVEYRGLRKANAFIDRRFGEDDERLTEEERALARFQAQRIRDARREMLMQFTQAKDHEEKAGFAGAKKFNLTEDGVGERDEEQELTHLGKALSALEAEEEGLVQQKGASDDEDDDITATADWAEKYHFGGGKGGASAGSGDAAGGEEGGGSHKTKKQIMEEIIQKSKQHKAEKSRQREEDEEEALALDDRFSALVQRGCLVRIMKAAGEGRGKAAGLQGESEQDKEYEVMRREMAFEGRAKAGERLRTPEELEALERERLEQLERLRRKRMRTPAGDDGGGEDSEADADGVAGPSGGYAARRRRLQQRLQREEEKQRPAEPAGLQSGDTEEDSFQLGGDDDISAMEDSQDEDGSEDSDASRPRALSKLEARRQQQAAGDHPLQAAFREASRRLLAMRGEGGEDGEEEEEGSEEEGEEGSEGGEEESEEGEEGEEEEEACSEDVDVKEGEAEEGEGGEEAGEEEEELGRQHMGAAEDGEEQQQQAACSEEAVTRQRVERVTLSKEASTSLVAAGPLELPFTLPVPQSLKQFRALVEGRAAADLAAVIARIRAYNAPLPAADNQHKLQVFYGILVSHYAALAAQAPLPREHLDAMVPPLLEVSADVPLYAGEAARARLAKMNDELSQRLKAPWEAAAIWPGARAVLLLKLFLTLFPASDRQHPVCTPATHFIGRTLSHCPVSSARHAAHGLLFCGLALELAAPARRLFPEVVTFCSSLLEVAAAELLREKSRGAATTVGRWLGAARAQLRSVGAVPDLQLWSMLEAGGASATLGAGGASAQLQASVLRAALLMQRRALALVEALPSLPELVQPAVAACERLQEAAAHLPEALVHEAAASCKQLQAAAARTVAERRPLVRGGSASGAPAVKPLNPKFEEDFRAGKDYDPDRVRAEERKLKRKVAKEKRGAVRELRKDAAFMAEQRDQERAVVDAERLASERSFYSMLQQQQADARSGGQSGMNPHLKAKKKKQRRL